MSAGAAEMGGGGGAWGLEGAGALGLEKRTVACSLSLFTLKDLFGLYGVESFTKALGESGGASNIGSSWPWSEHCLWVGVQV